MVPHLSRSSLEYAVDNLYIIRSFRIGECLDYQCRAVEENLPLVVSFSVNVCSSSKYCHFQCTSMSILIDIDYFVNLWLLPMIL